MAYVPVKLTEEEIAELEAKHEDVLVLSGSDKAPWTVALRRPTRQETIAYKQTAKRDPATANEILIRRIQVAPLGPDMEKQIERWPFLCDAVADAESFKDFLGLTVGAQVK